MKQTKLLTAVIAGMSILGASAGFAADEAQQQAREQVRMTEDGGQISDQTQDQDQERVRKMLNEDQGKGEKVRNRHRYEDGKKLKAMKRQSSPEFEMDRPRSNGGFSAGGSGGGRGR